MIQKPIQKERWSTVIHPPEKSRRMYVVSFSGIDGAGKSTQIEFLLARLRSHGLRVRLISFWDDIASLTGIRETTGHKVFKGEKGVGAPGAPIARQDKNVRSWYMTLIRLCLYFLDTLSARRVLRKASRSDVDVVICDRYSYDELANLPLRNPVIRSYVRMICKLAPKTRISFFLDVDPILARARKPEYPLSFLYTNRQAYLELQGIVGGMTIIGAKTIEEVREDIWNHTMRKLSLESMNREDQGATGQQANSASA